MINSQDRLYLIKLKETLLDNCKLCKGTDPSCECQAKFLFEAKLITACIPAKYRPFELKDINFVESTSVVKKIGSYIKNLQGHYEKGMGLYLYGNTGTCKSVLSCIILKEAIRKEYGSRFISFPDCLELIKAGWKDEELKQEFKRLVAIDFLVIDDVGREYKTNSGFGEANLDELIRKRTDSLLPTIITSNEKVSDLGADYGACLLSILHEHFIFIEFSASDYRKKVLSKQKDL